MPTRRITSSPFKLAGTAPDCRQVESAIGEEFFAVLRFNRLGCGQRPLTLEWRDVTGKFRKYTPDALMRQRTDLPEATGRVVLCAVKPGLNTEKKSPRRRKPRKEDEEENALERAAAEHHAARQGWQFKVCRKSEIRAPCCDGARRENELARHEINALPAEAA